MLAGSVTAVVFMTAQSASAAIEDHSPATWNMQDSQNTLDNKWQLGVRRLINEGHDVIALQEAGQVPRSAGEWDDSLNRIVPGQVVATFHFLNGITNSGGTQGWTVRQYDWRPNGSRGGTYHIFYLQTDFSTSSRVNLAFVTTQEPDAVNVAAPAFINSSNVATSRPALGVRFGNTYFWDLHALSGGGNDASRLLASINATSNAAATQGNPITWAAMGDFNRAPSNITPQTNPVQPTYYTYNTGAATHYSGNELDYMVATEDIQTYLAGSSDFGSDHRAVFFGEMGAQADVNLTIPSFGDATVVPDPNAQNDDVSVLDANHLGGATETTWYVLRDPQVPNRITIQNYGTGLCLDAAAQTVTERTCDGSEEQDFNVAMRSDGLIVLNPFAKGSCLGVPSSSQMGVGILDSTLSCGSSAAGFKFRFDHDPGDGAAGAIMHLQQNPGQGYTVAQDGSADFASIQDAIDAVPADGNPHTIVIQPGVYYEPISVPSYLTNLTIEGSTGKPGDVVISYGNAHGMTSPWTGQLYGTTGSATATFLPNNLTVTGLTIENSFNTYAHPEIDQYSTQAVAVAAEGDRQVFANDNILGMQDTVEVWSRNPSAQNRQYFHSDYISGNVDFIFGNADAVFNGDYIQELDRGATLGGNIVAPNTDSSDPFGILIINSAIDSSAQANTFTLARTWHNTPTAVGQLVVRNTTLPAGIITSAPYTAIDPSFPWQDARFAEYFNSGAGAGVNANRPQLTDAQAAGYTAQTYLAGSDGWNPVG